MTEPTPSISDGDETHVLDYELADAVVVESKEQMLSLIHI